MSIASCVSAGGSQDACVQESKQQQEQRRRLHFSPEEYQVLEASFEDSPYPTHEELLRLSSVIGKPHRNLRMWFSNMRRKRKRMFMEQQREASGGQASYFSASNVGDVSPQGYGKGPGHMLSSSVGVTQKPQSVAKRLVWQHMTPEQMQSHHHHQHQDVATHSMLPPASKGQQDALAGGAFPGVSEVEETVSVHARSQLRHPQQQPPLSQSFLQRPAMDLAYPSFQYPSLERRNSMSSMEDGVGLPAFLTRGATATALDCDAGGWGLREEQHMSQRGRRMSEDAAVMEGGLADLEGACNPPVTISHGWPHYGANSFVEFRSVEDAMDVDESGASSSNYTSSGIGTSSIEYPWLDGDYRTCYESVEDEGTTHMVYADGTMSSRVYGRHGRAGGSGDVGHFGRGPSAPWHNRNFLDIVANSSSAGSTTSTSTTTGTTTTTGMDMSSVGHTRSSSGILSEYTDSQGGGVAATNCDPGIFRHR